jgi:predicted acyltransferase
MNPLFVAALLLFVSLMAMRLLAGVAPRLRPGRAALLLAAALVVANWAYVIRTDHPDRPAAQRRDAPAPAPAAQGGSLPSGTSGG